MLYHLKLECIGDDQTKLGGIYSALLGSIPSRAWVARVKCIHKNYVQREFIKPQKGYSNANGVGSRGVMAHYFLDDGIYEISDPQSWKNTDRYFAYIEDGELWKVTREEAIAWLNDHLE